MTKNRRFKQWEDINAIKLNDFRALYYAILRILGKFESKILHMGRVYKALEKELQELKSRK